MVLKVPRNENFTKLSAGYLFPVINQKKREFLATNPDAKLISLGPNPPFMECTPKASVPACLHARLRQQRESARRNMQCREGDCARTMGRKTRVFF